MELIKDFNIDNCCVTETWFKKSDTAKFSEIKELGYETMSTPRSGRGGGVAFLFKSSLNLKKQKSVKYKTFEIAVASLLCQNGSTLWISCLYRSGTPTAMSANIPLFFEEFENYLSSLIDKPGRPIILGDFNIHVEDPNCPTANKFSSLLNTNGWIQNVVGSTHIGGGTLDLVITRAQSVKLDQLNIKDICISETGTTSDHYLVSFECDMVGICNLAPITKQYRKITPLEQNVIAEKILYSELCETNKFSTLDNAVVLYNKELQNILDQHAPIKTFTLKPKRCEWWSKDCQLARTRRRKAERNYLKLIKKNECIEDIEEAKSNYKFSAKEAAKLITSTRIQYYKLKLQKCGKNAKQSYSLVNKLLNNSSSPKLPSCTNDSKLANNFKEFFEDKVEKIYDGITKKQTEVPNKNSHFKSTTRVELSEFKPITDESLSSIIHGMAKKHCDLDPIPTSMLIDCLPTLLPLISYIVNSSLSSGTFPKDLKNSLVRPSLKDNDLDNELYNSFRPISNLSFLSKVIEKCGFIQISEYVEHNKLLSKFQSGYRKYHSCETATLKIHNDILLMCDDNSNVIILLLDLSAAFDTVNHQRLLQKLQSLYNISGTVLNWLKSYLSNRSFKVKVNYTCSESGRIKISVPQGSILGPLLFILYTKDLEDIAATHGFIIHLYADDTQLYITFDPTTNTSNLETRVIKCMKHINEWMIQFFLKLNEDKTDALVISPKYHNVHENIEKLKLNLKGDTVELKDDVISLGVLFETKLSMSSFVNKIVNACNSHIRNLWYLASKLSFKMKIQLVHTLIHSRLDYCNSILYGISSKDMARLQKAQNSAVRFIFGRGKRSHVTKLLMKVHFLPVRYRILFKIALLVYKCINNNAPLYLKELILLREPTNFSLRIDNDFFLLNNPNPPHLKCTEKSFCYSAPKIWNSLPYNIRSSESVTAFKKKIKTFYFQKAYSSVLEQ